MKIGHKKLLLSLATLSCVSANIQAATIPVCSKLQEPTPKVESSVDELMHKADQFVKKKKYCKAARELQLSFIKDQAQALEYGADVKILETLEKGKYLNDFMTFSLSLKKIIKEHPRQEYLDYLMSRTYQSNLPKNAKSNPTGNLTKADGIPLGIIEETKLIQKTFLKNYPDSQHKEEMQNILSRAEDLSLEKAEMQFSDDYKSLKRSKNARILNYHAAILAKSIKANNSRKGRIRALSSLLSLYNKNKGVIEDAELRIMQILDIAENELQDKKLAKKARKALRSSNTKGNIQSSISEFSDEVVSSSELHQNSLNDKDLKELLKRKKGNDKSIFLPLKVTDSEKTIILRTLGVVGVLMAFDKPLMDFVQDNQNDTMTAITDFTNNFGELTGVGPIIGTSMALGLVFKNDQLKRAAIRSLGAIAIGQLTVEFMKAMTHRSRPRDNKGPYDFGGPGWSSDNTSFPSGHSAGAWSVMTVFATEFKDHKIIPTVAYSLAALTSFARVYKNAHWLSDVTLGALVGWISGKLMYKIFKTKKKKDGVSFEPVMGEMTGGSLTMRSSGQDDMKAWPVDYYKLNFTN